MYVRDRLATDTKLKKWPPSVQDEIIATMMEKADGMYGCVIMDHAQFANNKVGFIGCTVNLNPFDIVSN